jgi:hypothetical protein
VGADEQLRRDRGSAPRARTRVVFVVDSSFEGLLEAKGFEERGMRMAPPEEHADPTAEPWSEFIRVTGAGVPQADDRAAGDRHETDLGGSRRRRPVLARPADADLGGRPARRRVHGQRHRLPCGGARRVPVGPLRLGEPARDARSGPPAPALGAAHRRPEPVAGVPRRVATSTAGYTRTCWPSTTSSGSPSASSPALPTSSTPTRRG